MRLHPIHMWGLPLRKSASKVMLSSGREMLGRKLCREFVAFGLVLMAVLFWFLDIVMRVMKVVRVAFCLETWSCRRLQGDLHRRLLR